jgi:hypothetical protein
MLLLQSGFRSIWTWDCSTKTSIVYTEPRLCKMPSRCQQGSNSLSGDNHHNTLYILVSTHDGWVTNALLAVILHATKAYHIRYNAYGNYKLRTGVSRNRWHNWVCHGEYPNHFGIISRGLYVPQEQDTGVSVLLKLLYAWLSDKHL